VDENRGVVFVSEIQTNTLCILPSEGMLIGLNSRMLTLTPNSN
jgi:hypothetical protein